MLVLFFAALAAAAVNPEAYFAQLHCTPPGNLRGAVRSCDANDLYSDAAALCLKTFEESAATYQKALSAGGAAKGQAGSEADAKKKYADTLAALDVMIAASARLKAEIEAYKNEVVLPDDLGPVQDGSVEITSFLRSNPCYWMSQELLGKTADVMRLKGEELRLTRKIAEKQLGRSGLRASLLNGGTAAPAARGTSKAGPAGKASTGGSTITGIEEDKAKQRK